jgi:hypothetical protein
MTKKPRDIQAISALRETLDRLIADASVNTLSDHKRRQLETDVQGVIDDLTTLLTRLDPIAQPTSVFDPSNPKVVGRFVALALVAQSRHSLSEVPKFYGSGVYAVYYRGAFKAYQAISGTETPIYVGQASPMMRNARTPVEQGAKLCGRLNEHRKNITKASTTLNIDDFEFRSLVVQSGWETAAEDYLIHLFRPIWNSETNILYGLGKHGDAATTRGNRRSPWDTLHPGRSWAAGSTEDAKSLEKIDSELNAHFSGHLAYPNLEAVLASFIDELRQA